MPSWMQDFVGLIFSASLGITGVGVERTICHDLHEGGVDCLPRLDEVERQRANTVTVRGKFGGEVARSAGVEEDALGLLPAWFTGLLTQVGEDLIEVLRTELWRPVRAAFERLGVEFGVEDDCTTVTEQAHVGFHARHQRQRIRVWGDKLPLDDGGADVPAAGMFVPVKIEDELFKERRQPVPDEVPEAPGTAVLGGQPMLVDELTDMQQEGVDAVIAVELDAAEVLGVEFDVPDGSEPAQQVMHVGAGGRGEFLRVVEPLKRGLEYPVRQSVVFEFVPCAGGAAVAAEKVAAQGLGDEQLATYAGDFLLTGEVATVQAAPEQAEGAVHQHAGEETEEVGGIPRVHIG